MGTSEYDTSEYDVRGVWVRGRDPKELVLSDGSRLRLEAGLGADGEMGWQRTGDDGETAPVSTEEAFDLAGRAYGRYVAVRTRAEAEWLRAIAEWCRSEALRLERGLAAAAA